MLDLGNRSVVFKKEAGVFIPKEIKPKITTRWNGTIEADISDWEIAGNAAFMVDSESFIKTN